MWTYTEIAFFSRKVQTHRSEMFVTSSQVTPRGGRRHIVRYCKFHHTTLPCCHSHAQKKYHAHAQPESRAMAHSIQHSHSRRAEQRLTPSSTCNGSAHAKLESRAMARSIQQWLTPSSTCKAGEQSNGSLHLAHVMAHSIQHMQSRRAEQWLTPSSTCKAGEQSNGSLHPAHTKPESRAMVHSIQHMQSRRAEQWLAPSSTTTASC